MTHANDTKRAAAITATITMNTDSPTDPNNALSLVFANGQTLKLPIGALSEGIIAQATLHGLKQKLVDAAAIARNPDTGRSATIEDKFEAVKAVYDRLLGGAWNAAREGAGGGSGGLLFRALVKMYDGRKSPADIREFLEGKTDAEKAALRKNPKVSAIIETLRAAPDTDTDAMLDELN